MEDLEEFVHRQNLTIFRRQVDLVEDEARRQWLLERLRRRGESPGRDQMDDDPHTTKELLMGGVS